MRAIFLAGLIAAVMVQAAPASARTPSACSKGEKTARQCKERDCQALFETNLGACSELPANKSCPDMAKAQKVRCDQFCDANYSDAAIDCEKK
ncbi:hypothetical protein IC762_31810 [Bradyrhizobium genosp. L]|uniref:hypothetical protein n=1 Tax=Bradyrhizobium genosp. L TaxID=83637 RepID=UPI0018A25734|nr:hypothetical protein [Bradyrhizobium genosp. L]QPF84156.1 hypothetical protein IC762_31810 [Bradyrhizobium genosp. L]